MDKCGSWASVSYLQQVTQNVDFPVTGNVNTCKEKDIDLKQMSQKATSKAFLWLSENLMKSGFSPYETVNLTLYT